MHPKTTTDHHPQNPKERQFGTGCKRNTGAFVYYNGQWKFLYKNDAAAFDEAARNGGMGFGQEMMIHENSLLPIVNFHFPSTSTIGSVRARSDKRPLSTPRRTTPRISFSSNELMSVNSDCCLSQANMSGLLRRKRSSYMSRGISFVVLSTL